MSLPLTPMAQLRLLMDNDDRNIESMPVISREGRNICVVMCAERYIAAREMGQEMERRALRNLRTALERR